VTGLAALTVVVLMSGCGGQRSAAPSPGAPTPPSADLITYNQAATVGLSIPVEGAIQRSTGFLQLSPYLPEVGKKGASGGFSQVRGAG